MEVAAHVDDYNASFRDTVWLQSFPLNAQTVLHYFALSPFYDRSCNNERLKMQRLGLDQLKNLRGVEYELLPNVARQLPQQLYIIRKQRRNGRTQVEPLAIYYVLDGTVYQAPNIHAMLTSRLKKCSYRINKAFHGLAAGVRFSPTEGYAWDFSSKDKKEPVIPSEREIKLISYLLFSKLMPILCDCLELQLKLKQKYEKLEKQRENSARVDAILIQLMKKHAPEIAEKLENNNGTAVATVPEDSAIVKRETDGIGTEIAKRQKVA